MAYVVCRVLRFFSLAHREGTPFSKPMRCWRLFLYQVAWHYRTVSGYFQWYSAIPSHMLVLLNASRHAKFQSKLPRPIALLGIFGGLVSGLLGALLMTILAWWPQGVTLVAPTGQTPLHLTSAKMC